MIIFCFRLASILDPRIKAGGFGDQTNYRNGVDKLKTEVSALIKEKSRELRTTDKEIDEEKDQGQHSSSRVTIYLRCI
jgi:hypothetical protein